MKSSFEFQLRLANFDLRVADEILNKNVILRRGMRAWRAERKSKDLQVARTRDADAGPTSRK